jgi:oligosaccharyltransferase complex subunit delta (ribophorin II)
VWDLGNVELQLGAAPVETPSPLYKKPLLHESDTTLKALPEIKHVMREDDPRPPVAVSLAFVGAVLAPLAFFLVFVARLGLNVKRLFEGSVFVFGCVFLASLGGILALFGLYWLELTMFRTLGYLSVLGSVNLWSGHLTLKRLAEAPAKKTTKVE